MPEEFTPAAVWVPIVIQNFKIHIQGPRVLEDLFYFGRPIPVQQGPDLFYACELDGLLFPSSHPSLSHCSVAVPTTDRRSFLSRRLVQAMTHLRNG